MKASRLFFKRGFRNPKNIFLFSVFFFSFLLITVTLEIKSNFNSYVENLINQNVNFRKIVLYKNLSEEALSEIEKDEHFLYYFPLNNMEVSLIIKDFVDLGYNGSINFISGLEGMAPKVVMGQNLKNDSYDEIICPIDFYPESIESFGNIDENKKININNYLNKTIKTNYKTYTIQNQQTKETEEKELKIVGFFDSALTSTKSNECFMSYNTLKEIRNSLSNESERVHMIIVDDVKNVSYMQNKLLDLGYQSKLGVKLETKFIETIQLVLNAVLLVTIALTILIVLNYLKKQFLLDQQAIEIKHYIGYKRKHIFYLKFVEMLPIILLSFLCTILFYIYMTWFIKKFIMWKINVLGFFINFHPQFIFISFLLSLILPVLLSLILVFFITNTNREKEVV